MRKVIFFLCLFLTNSYSQEIIDNKIVTPIEISKIFDESTIYKLSNFLNLIEREEKVESCVVSYLDKKIRSNSKVTKQILYDLMRNFNRITLRIYGKKIESDNTSYEEKLKIVARIQCEAYYNMGVLK